MSLILAENSTDNVDMGAGASLANKSPGGVLWWMYPTDVSNNLRRIFGKHGGTQALQCFRIGVDGTAFRFQWGRSTTALSVDSTTAALVVNTWFCFAVLWNEAAGTASIWKATLSSGFVDVSTGLTAGSGTHDDAAGVFRFGSDGTTTAAGMRLGPAAFLGANPSQADLNSWWRIARKQLFANAAVGFWRFGNEGAGSQQDYSGNGNTGTVTGATQALNGPPLPHYGYRHGLYVPQHLLAV